MQVKGARERVAHGLAGQVDMADKQVAATIEQIDREEIRGAPHLGAAVAGHGGSSLSVVLAGGAYRWISKALSTLRHLNRSYRRRIDIAGGRVENGEAFSTRHFLATSLPRCPPQHINPAGYIAGLSLTSTSESAVAQDF